MAAPTNRRLITEARLLDGTGKVKTTLLPAELGLSEAEVAEIIGETVFDPDGILITENPEGDAITVTDGGSSADVLAINAQTGTSYTLVLSDVGKLVTLNNAASITLTVPTNASVGFLAGTQITLAQLGVGQVTVVGASGVTVNGAPGLKLTDQYSAATLIKLATNTWLLVGRLSL